MPDCNWRESGFEARQPVHRQRQPDRDQPLRIALFTYSTQPRGGVVHTLALAEAFHDLGHDVMLHALDDAGRGFIRTPRCPYTLIPVETNRQAILSFVRERVAAYVAAWDRATPAYDVYHAHDGISGNALATLVQTGAIPSFVRTVHHIDDFNSPEVDALQTRAIVSAKGCLVVSNVERARMKANYGIDATVVPNGVDTQRFTPVGAPERTALRERLKYAGGPIFVTIGGIEARKNTVLLLEAFARVHAVRPDSHLVIAGGASVLDHSAYRRMFDERLATFRADVAQNVHIVGVLSDERIVELLQASDAFVFPSLIEGFGLVVLEALACGTPIITSAIAPFTEFLTPDDALLVDPSDPLALCTAMLRSLEGDVQASVRERGPIIARRFSWPASARAHVAAYESIFASGGVAAHA